MAAEGRGLHVLCAESSDSVRYANHLSPQSRASASPSFCLEPPGQTDKGAGPGHSHMSLVTDI